MLQDLLGIDSARPDPDGFECLRHFRIALRGSHKGLKNPSMWPVQQPDKISKLKPDVLAQIACIGKRHLLGDVFPERFNQHGRLVRPPAVNGRLAGSGALGDGIGGGVGETLLFEHLKGGRENTVPSFFVTRAPAGFMSRFFR